MTWEVRHGDCLDGMRGLDANSVDAIVCDPPYGLSFMGKDWDHGVPGAAFWAEALRVAKPGAHLLAFGGTRTFHRLACAIEDAGWEIRDCLSWLYGSGFPKSHNGPWGGTALKPAWEPILMARKPLVGTVAANVAAHGTGALNVDGCRLPTTDKLGGSHVSSRAQGWDRPWKDDPDALERGRQRWAEADAKANALGRWPANVALDEDAAAMLDEQSGERPGGAFPAHRNTSGYSGGLNQGATPHGFRSMGDTGGASRFFYCAKASRSERGEGNNHPTVKPIALMRWLCRLVTPPGGLILDPFTGSGTTGCAAVLEGFRFIGFEREAEYVEIARRRIAHHAATVQPDLNPCA